MKIFKKKKKKNERKYFDEEKFTKYINNVRLKVIIERNRRIIDHSYRSLNEFH